MTLLEPIKTNTQNAKQLVDPPMLKNLSTALMFNFKLKPELMYCQYEWVIQKFKFQ